MRAVKNDIITELKNSILSLQGFKPLVANNGSTPRLGVIDHSFPNANFPIGAIHEFICGNKEEATASSGFVSGLLSTLMNNNGVSVWIHSSQNIFAPALKLFLIDPSRIIFINPKKESDILWTMEEALKCNGLAAVVADLPGMSLTASRRLQLAVEQTRVTGFILHCSSRTITNTAAVTRWKITHVRSETEKKLPGVGFPRWNVELLKVRNGKPGKWKVEWKLGAFNVIEHEHVMESIKHLKTG